MRKVFFLSAALVALLMLVSCSHGGASSISGVQSSAEPKGSSAGLPPGMKDFPGVRVPDLPGWDTRSVGPVPLAVARTMMERECHAFMVVMSRPGSSNDRPMIDAMYAASATLGPDEGVATLREKLADGFVVNRLLPDGRRACVAYRSLADEKGRILVRVAARWSAKCGDAPTDAFLTVVRGLQKN